MKKLPDIFLNRLLIFLLFLLGYQAHAKTVPTLAGEGTNGSTNGVVTANRPFITRWDLSKTGSSSTGLSIGVQTASGQQVSYSWTTVPAGTSGSGTFTGTSLSIANLPANAIIDVSIDPTNFQRIFINNGADRQRLTEIKQWGEVAWTSMEMAFDGCSNMILTATDVPNLTGVNMGYMFTNCSSFNQALPEGFNTANVTNMAGMFAFCSSYNQALPNSFNTANVTDMSGMFSDCSSYNQALPNSFNTSNVTNMAGMFNGCISYNQALPSSFNTANVTTMISMFRNCSSYNKELPSSFNTANVTNMSLIFVFPTTKRYRAVLTRQT